jgi:hypothetical protein
MTEPTSTITNWDQFLRIWAILGPLTVAAASALWSRYTKSQDRETEKLRESDRFERERKRDYERSELEHKHEMELIEHTNTTKKIELKSAKRDERYVEAKDAIVNFMAYSQEYTLKQMDYLSNLTPELKNAARLIHEKYNYSYQLVYLIGSDAIRNAATGLWNLSIELPTKGAAKPHDKEEYEKVLKDYKDAKSKFSEVAREYLHSLDPHVH